MKKFFTILLFSCCSLTLCLSQIEAVEKRFVDDGVKVAETYWNSLKISDKALFQSVTPQPPSLMTVVFDWAYVNKSDVVAEDGRLIDIKTSLEQFLDHNKKYESLPKYTDSSMAELKIRDSYADTIEKSGYPLFASFIKKSWWSAIIPLNITEKNKYTLLTMKYIADVKVQSKGGFVLQKRTTSHLYRMIADDIDSGWKVFFVEGLL